MKYANIRYFASLAIALSVAAISQESASRVADAQYSAGNFGAYGYRPLTLYESRARGQAELVRARGQNNLYNSEAAINATQARSNQLDNNLKNAETYFAMRNLNKEQRFGTDQERAAQRQKNQAKQLFRYG